MEDVDSNYISSCLYHPLSAPLCPIFKLGDIIKLSGLNFQTVAKVVSLSFCFFLKFLSCFRVLLLFFSCCDEDGVCVLTGRSHRDRGRLDV